MVPILLITRDRIFHYTSARDEGYHSYLYIYSCPKSLYCERVHHRKYFPFISPSPPRPHCLVQKTPKYLYPCCSFSAWWGRRRRRSDKAPTLFGYRYNAIKPIFSKGGTIGWWCYAPLLLHVLSSVAAGGELAGWLGTCVGYENVYVLYVSWVRCWWWWWGPTQKEWWTFLLTAYWLIGGHGHEGGKGEVCDAETEWNISWHNSLILLLFIKERYVVYSVPRQMMLRRVIGLKEWCKYCS